MERKIAVKKTSLMFGIYLLLVLLLIGSILYLTPFIEPKIAIRAEINSITAEDYKRIKERTDPFINSASEDDFKKINFHLDYSEPLFIISNRKIEFDGIRSVLLGNKVINLSGGYSERDNSNERFASYSESAEVYLNGLSLSQFEDLFKDKKIVIYWDKLGTGREERVYYVQDLLDAN